MQVGSTKQKQLASIGITCTKTMPMCDIATKYHINNLHAATVFVKHRHQRWCAPWSIATQNTTPTQIKTITLHFDFNIFGSAGHAKPMQEIPTTELRNSRSV